MQIILVTLSSYAYTVPRLYMSRRRGHSSAAPFATTLCHIPYSTGEDRDDRTTSTFFYFNFVFPDYTYIPIHDRRMSTHSKGYLKPRSTPLATSVSVTHGNGPGARNERIEDEAQALCGGVHHPLRGSSSFLKPAGGRGKGRLMQHLTPSLCL